MSKHSKPLLHPSDGLSVVELSQLCEDTIAQALSGTVVVIIYCVLVKVLQNEYERAYAAVFSLASETKTKASGTLALR